MSELLGTTVEEVIQVMKERRVRIPSEIGAFVALEVCESLEKGPAVVKRGDVLIADDGSISVFAPPGSATSEEAARSVVALLGSLLVAAGTGVPRVLVGLMEAGPSSGRWDLSSLRDDLEASLVPLNRGAARRVLARMLREVRKPRQSSVPTAAHSPARAAPPPTDNTLDAQLDDLLGGPPDEPAPRSSAPPADDLDAMLDATMSELNPPSSPPGRDDVPADDRTLADDSPPDFTDEPVLPGRRFPSDAPTGEVQTEAPSAQSGGIDLEALDAELEKSKKGSPLPWILAFAAILTATAAAVALMRPDLVDAMLGRPPPPPPEEGPTEEDRERMMREHRAHWGTLMVEVRPEDAQILMFVGRGPAEAVEIPLGAATEFVAIADGRVPGRGVVPSDAEWTSDDDGHSYDLAIQVGAEEMPEEDLALGDTLLRGMNLGGPSGAVGTVRVITNPPGAKVYQLVGYSPRAILENIPTDEAVELIIWHEEHPISRTVVSPSDWIEDADGSKTASVELTLEGYEPPETEE